MWRRRTAAILIGFSVSLGVAAGCGGGGSQARDAAADRAPGSGGATGTASGGATGSGGTTGTSSGGSSASGGEPGTGGMITAGSGGTSSGGSGGDSTAAGGRGGGASGGASASGGRGGGSASGGNGGSAQSGGRGGNGGGGSGSGGRGTGGAASGGSSTGGAASGGSGTGGAATGGAGGVGGTPVLATGTCVAPCALKFAANPISGLAEGAILYVNLTTGASQLRDSAANPPPGTTPLMQFSFDPAAGSNHGYHLSFTGGNLWDEWTEPYEYDTTVGMYSVKQFVSMTMEMVETAANKLILLTAYLVDHGVVVQSVRFPTCTTGTGVCRNATDCPIVTAGSAGPVATSCDLTCTSGLSCASQCTSTGSGLSLACSDCYSRFFACSRTMCPDQFECPTPRLAGNGCMRCQVDKGCARAFMNCAGLDHMPLGTLLLPLPN